MGGGGSSAVLGIGHPSDAPRGPAATGGDGGPAPYSDSLCRGEQHTGVEDSEEYQRQKADLLLRGVQSKFAAEALIEEKDLPRGRPNDGPEPARRGAPAVTAKGRKDVFPAGRAGGTSGLGPDLIRTPGTPGSGTRRGGRSGRNKLHIRYGCLAVRSNLIL